MKKTIILTMAVLLTGLTVFAGGKDKDKDKDKFPIQVFCPKPDMLYKQDGDFPFAFYWRRDYIDIRKFDKIVVKPMESKFWDVDDDNKKQEEEVKLMADMLNAEIVRAINAEGQHIELKTTAKPDAKTMILEVAVVPLMKLEYFRRYINYRSGASYSGDNLPFGMICLKLAAIEAVVKCGDDGSLVAQIAGICKVPEDVEYMNETKWRNITSRMFRDWSKNFVATIKAELNRDKDGKYLSISGKIPVVAPPVAKEQKK